ncbi:MAG: AAA family ATPase [Nitrososphaera sp.]|nr:AAA family ATPase [Nitrososphaera sp.]
MNLIEKAVSEFFKEPAFDAVNQGATLLRATHPPALEESLSPHFTAKQQTSLDFNKLKQLGMITPDVPSSRIALELRHIKSRLLSGAIETMNVLHNDHCQNLIMITSSGTDEGKTFLSINLAINLAMEVDRRIVLVDTDVTKGNVAKILGIEPKLGLTDLLVTPNQTMLDALVGTNIDRLHVIPAGTAIPNVAELFASQRMISLLSMMARQYADWVFVFDSPPLLAASESSALARHMGQVVVVVQEEKTTQKDLLTGLKQIEFAKNIGLVLNKSLDRSETIYYEQYAKFHGIRE